MAAAVAKATKTRANPKTKTKVVAAVRPSLKVLPAQAQSKKEPSQETERYGDWWEAPHQVIQMLAVVLARYGENEGRWRRSDVQADLLKANTAISACLKRGVLKEVR